MHDLNRPQGSIIIDSGTGEPILARAVWANPQIPPDWNYEDDIPRFKPKQVVPLGLYERVYLQRYEKATTGDSETESGERETRKESTPEAKGKKAVKQTSKKEECSAPKATQAEKKAPSQTPAKTSNSHRKPPKPSGKDNPAGKKDILDLLD
ncbi:MAG: hypothetical protein V1736_07795 [Pseudomonadota bacterium]